MVKKDIPKNITLNLGTTIKGRGAGASTAVSAEFKRVNSLILSFIKQTQDRTIVLVEGEPQTEEIEYQQLYKKLEPRMIEVRGNIDLNSILTREEKKGLYAVLKIHWDKLVKEAREEYIKEGNTKRSAEEKYPFLRKLTNTYTYIERGRTNRRRGNEDEATAGNRRRDSESIESNESIENNQEEEEGAGLKKKKRRGRPRKTAPKEVIIKEVLPHQKFSRKANKALDQLLEATREKEKAEVESGLKELVRMRGAGLEDDLKALKEKRKKEYFDKAIFNEDKVPSLKKLNKEIDEIEEQIEAAKAKIEEQIEAAKAARLKAAQDRIKAGLDKSGKPKEDTDQDGRGLRGAGNKDDDYDEDIFTGEKTLKPIEERQIKNIPQFGSTTLKLPPFFAVPTKKGWRLANPLTEIRNLANRQHELSINIKRANVKKPELDFSVPRVLPRLEQFSKKDQDKLRAYIKAVEEGREQEYLFKNKPRGFPAVLYKNARKAGLRETKEKVYTKNTLKPKKAPSKKVPSKVRPQKQPKEVVIEREEIEEEPQQASKKKVNTAEEYLEDFDLEKFYEELVKVWKRYVAPGNHREAIEYTKNYADKIIRGLNEVEIPPAELEKVKKTAFRIGNQMGFLFSKMPDKYVKELRAFFKEKEEAKKKESKGKGMCGFKEHSVMEDECEAEDQDGGCDGEGSGGSLTAKDLKALLGASYKPTDKVNDFDLDKEISSPTSKVYFNKKTGQAVVAHRGTQGLIDWGNNLVYAAGGEWAYKKTRRYKEAERVQKKAERKYGAENVSTIGHSQGGLQAELAGKKSKEIITLNKATRPFGNTKQEKQTDIRTTGDVVSALNPFQRRNKKEIVIKSKSYNPVEEHKTKALEGLDENVVIGEGLAELFSPYTNIMPSQGGRMLGLTRHAVLPAHAGHPALVSDQYPRIPQSFTQVHLSHPRPIGSGLGAGMKCEYDSDSDMEGGRMCGGRTYAQRLRARARRAFAPIERTFTPKLGRQIGKTLIHDALPAVVSGVVGTATTALTGNPALGLAAGQTLGKVAGKKAGDSLGKVAGMGMKRPKLVKGSKEAKEYMASIRSKRMKGGEMPPRSRGIITDPSLL